MSGRSEARGRAGRRRGGEGTGSRLAASVTSATGGAADDVRTAVGELKGTGEVTARSGPAGGVEGGETDANVVRDGFVLDFISGQ